MRIGTIGTGAIVDRMIEAIKRTENVELVAVYSRTAEKAEAFAYKHGVSTWYTDLDAMMQDDLIDTIYIASPNSLHFSQAKKALLAKKNVINEKPFTPTLKECDELFDLAEKMGVYIFEAITTIHLPNYKIVKDHLKDVGDLKMIQCNFSQFSSRYDLYKAHKHTNVFDPAFHGGALMDINVYCIHFVVDLLGKPDFVQYFANIGYNGIDTSGTLIMKYPNVLVICTGAKDSSSENAVYLQGDQGTLRVYGSSCGQCKHVEFIPPKQDMIGKVDTTVTTSLGIEQDLHMVYECQDFQYVMETKNKELYSRWKEETRMVVSILEKACVY